MNNLCSYEMEVLRIVRRGEILNEEPGASALHALELLRNHGLIVQHPDGSWNTTDAGNALLVPRAV